MASIKVKYRQSSVVDRDGVIYYQILHNRIPRQIATDYRVRPGEWDGRRSNVVVEDKSREAIIMSIRNRMRRDIKRLNQIISKLNDSIMDYTADDIVEKFKRYTNEHSFINYMENTIDRLIQNGKIGTAENYRSALNSFKKFLTSQVPEYAGNNNMNITLDCISPELMEMYEAWQRSIGNIPNTISFYVRIFRAVYKRAVDENIIDDRKPFRRVYTGVDKTEKRALPLGVIRMIKSLDLSLKPKLDHARDIFFLSLYLRGMSFIDLCFLRKSDLKDGAVTYRRRKTGQQLTIAWTKEMQKIIDKYPENESEYLLPIITKSGINERSAYKNACYKINSYLKKIGEMINAPGYQGWSLYYARHSWASLAKSRGIPVSVISEAMGHDNEKTTQIYLASLETSVVDHANELIISLIR